MNPEGRATSYEFQYGTSGLVRAADGAAAPAGSGTGAVPVKATITGLAPGSAYHFRVERDEFGRHRHRRRRDVRRGRRGAGGPARAPFVTSTSAAARAPSTRGERARPTSSSTERAPRTAADRAGERRGGDLPAPRARRSRASPRAPSITTASSRRTRRGTTSGADASLITTGSQAGRRRAAAVSTGGPRRSPTQRAAQRRPQSARAADDLVLRVWADDGLRRPDDCADDVGSGRGRSTSASMDSQAGTTFHFRLLAQTSSAIYVGPDLTFTTKRTPRLRAKGLSVTASATASRGRVAIAVYGGLRRRPRPSAPTTAPGSWRLPSSAAPTRSRCAARSCARTAATARASRSPPPACAATAPRHPRPLHRQRRC